LPSFFNCRAIIYWQKRCGDTVPFGPEYSVVRDARYEYVTHKALIRNKAATTETDAVLPQSALAHAQYRLLLVDDFCMAVLGCSQGLSVVSVHK